MSISTSHGQMSVVDENGNVIILHQETSASDVIVDSASNTQGENGVSALPSSVNTLQKLTDNMGSMAFKSKVDDSDFTDDLDLIKMGDTEDGNFPSPVSEINDSVTAKDLTWSSKKINQLITDLTTQVNTLTAKINQLTNNS